MRAHPTSALAAALLLAAAGAACRPERQEPAARAADSATVPMMDTSVPISGPSTPATPVGGAADSADSGAAASSRGTGPGRAAQPGGTNAGARDTTSAARPPR